ncbi:MAG: class I SAM-dependent methyltransferase [Chloroflexi bacterium]|nr:class I SAM-dependent methyltransferase [Chloroflexota bacterium]
MDEDLDAVRTRMCGSVLEVGCGTVGRRGRFMPPIEQAANWAYVDLRDSARPTMRADIEHLPVQPACFDTVICLEVLEYVPNPRSALCELLRVLKPEGTLIISSPFLHRADAPTDSWRFTEHGLWSLLEEAGFKVQEVRQQGGALAVAVNILKFAVSRVETRLLRYALGLVAYAPLMTLLSIDGRAARQLPVLNTFSTGFLFVAIK